MAAVNREPFVHRVEFAFGDTPFANLVETCEKLAGELVWHSPPDVAGNTIYEADSHVFCDGSPRKWRIRNELRENQIVWVFAHDEELPTCHGYFSDFESARSKVELLRKEVFATGTFRVEIHDHEADVTAKPLADGCTVRATVDVEEEPSKAEMDEYRERVRRVQDELVQRNALVRHLENVTTKGADYVKRLEAKLANRDRTIRRLQEEVKAGRQRLSRYQSGLQDAYASCSYEQQRANRAEEKLESLETYLRVSDPTYAKAVEGIKQANQGKTSQYVSTPGLHLDYQPLRGPSPIWGKILDGIRERQELRLHTQLIPFMIAHFANLKYEAPKSEPPPAAKKERIQFTAREWEAMKYGLAVAIETRNSQITEYETTEILRKMEAVQVGDLANVEHPEKPASS